MSKLIFSLTGPKPELDCKLSEVIVGREGGFQLPIDRWQSCAKVG